MISALMTDPAVKDAMEIAPMIMKLDQGSRRYVAGLVDGLALSTVRQQQQQAQTQSTSVKKE